jgi:hypothetical protein
MHSMLLSTTLLLGSLSPGGEHAKPPVVYVIPYAHVMPPPLGYPAYPLPPYAYRPDPNEHWRYRAVSQRGFFRPVVIYNRHGSYYLYDHRPYYQETLNSWYWKP